MLFILKRIRLALLTNGSFGKYLLYILGETLLVVIGILIALAIDDRQTAKRNKLMEQDYYCQIKADLELDMIQLEGLRRDSRDDINAGKELIIELNNYQIDKDSAVVKFIQAGRSTAFVPTMVTYTDLISSGNLGLLENQKLKKKIILFYTDVVGINKIVEANRKYRTDKLLLGYNVLELGWQSFASQSLELDTDFLELLPDIKWHKDKNNPYFKQVIEVTFISITVAARNNEWFDRIENKIKPLQIELEQQCNALL